MTAVKRLWSRFYKAGYELRREVHLVGDDEEEVEVTFAYNPSGHFIGDSKTAHYLCVKKGIAPEPRTPDSNGCFIGYCRKEGKWYGWSHRAIYGFSVGDKVKKGDCTASSGWTDEYLKLHPELDFSLPVGFQALDIEDAKLMAIAFADSVS